jgi:hypothetical protein
MLIALLLGTSAACMWLAWSLIDAIVSPVPTAGLLISYAYLTVVCAFLCRPPLTYTWLACFSVLAFPEVFIL